MLSAQVLANVVGRIHACPELRNCRIGYYGEGRCRVLYEPTITLTGNEERIAIVLEEVVWSDYASIEELKRFAMGVGESPAGAPNPQLVTNRSKLGPELLGAGLACGLTIVSVLGVVGGVAAEVPTGGASSFLVAASWAGLATGGIQCLNGLVRVGAIARAPTDNTLQRWDKDPVYSNTILVVDAIGVATAVGSLPFQLRNLFSVLSRQKAFTARGLSFANLRAMNRAQRLKVVSEVFEEAAKTPEGRAALIEAAKQAGVGTKFAQSSGLSVRGGQKLSAVIKAETARRLLSSVRDVIAAGAGVTASGLPSEWVGSASGSVNTAIGYVVNAIELN